MAAHKIIKRKLSYNLETNKFKKHARTEQFSFTKHDNTRRKQLK